MSGFYIINSSCAFLMPLKCSIIENVHPPNWLENCQLTGMMKTIFISMESLKCCNQNVSSTFISREKYYFYIINYKNICLSKVKMSDSKFSGLNFVRTNN